MIPSKLMKEVCLGPQTDLVLLKEVGILTDGSFAKRRDGSEEYILTYSVSQMTDSVATSTVSTQTLLPRLPGDAFLEVCKHNIPIDQELLERCSEMEKRLLKQLTKLSKSEIPLTAKLNDTFFSETIDEENNSPTDTDSDISTVTIRSIPSGETSSKGNIRFNTYHPNLLYPTQLSWNFEYDTELMECSRKCSTYTIKGSTFLNNCMSLTYLQQTQSFDLNYFNLAIDELIDESNRLSDLIKQRKKKHNLILSEADCTKFKNCILATYKAPSDYWLPIIEEQEKNLTKLKHFKGIDIRNLEENKFCLN